MTRASTFPEALPARRFILPWGWALLLVILLSAMPTGAEPRSQLVGSAFDPASVSVALHPKSGDKNPALRIEQSGDPSPGFIDAPPFATIDRPGSLPAPLAGGPAAISWQPGDTVPEPGTFRQAHGPRAPPAA